MLESICYSHRRSLEKYIAQHGCPPKQISVVGGGACSDVWMQILADVLNVPVRIPAAPRHAGAVGTAYSAIIGLGLCAGYDDAAQRMQIDRIFTPNPDAAAVYKKQYSVYIQLYGALKNIFAQLNDKR